MLQDLRYSLRVLRKTPSFTIMALLTLALVIGANSALFSVVNTILLRPLPFPHGERLVGVWDSQPAINLPRISCSGPNFLEYQKANQSFEEMVAWTSTGVSLLGQGQPERLQGVRATHDALALFGGLPSLGRAFSAVEDRPGGPAVVLISHALWQRRYGADPGILGRNIVLDSIPHTVIGVLPSSFSFAGVFTPGTSVDVWLPLALDPADQNHGNHHIIATARLRPGVPLASARAELAGIAKRIEREHPDINRGWTAVANPLQEDVVGNLRNALLILMGAVALVLLIGVANVANLLLARAAVRRKEIAVRNALGATSSRLFRHMLAESLLLGLGGGGLGLLLAFWATEFANHIDVTQLPRSGRIEVDAAVLAFTAGISVLSGLLFGCAPMVQMRGVNLVHWLKDAAWSSSGGINVRLRGALVVGEVALALMVVIGAGLMGRSLSRARSVHPNFRPENLLTADVALPAAKWDQARNFFTRLVENTRALPGVESAALETPSAIWEIAIAGKPFKKEEAPQVYFRSVSPGYFRTMGIRVLRGRVIEERDAPKAAPVAVINEVAARTWWPNEDPIGKAILLPWSCANEPIQVVGIAQCAPIQVVGIVAEVKHFGLDAAPLPTAYFAEAQIPGPFGPVRNLLVRSKPGLDVMSLAPAIRNAVWALDREQPVGDIVSVSETLHGLLAPRRLYAWLFGSFSLLALVLAAVGVYGVVAYTVSQRTREIGIRRALGANVGHLSCLVVRQVLTLGLAGIAVGCMGALALSRLAANLVFGVGVRDGFTFAGGIAVLLAVLALASLVPLRRASQVDPVVALRQE